MGHTASHKNFRGMSVKHSMKEKQTYKQSTDDGGYSFEEVRKNI